MSSLTSQSKDASTEALYDMELVRRFLKGDEKAFGEIMLRHLKQLTVVAFKILKDMHDAEEIAQDAFIAAHRGLKGFKGESSLATWLHRITTNLAHNRYWYFQRRRRHLLRSLDAHVSQNCDFTLEEVLLSNPESPRRDCLRKEFQDALEIARSKLTEKRFEILVLRFEKKQSYQEISETLGINFGTVKSRIARGRQSIAASLTEFFGENYRDVLFGT